MTVRVPPRKGLQGLDVALLRRVGGVGLQVCLAGWVNLHLRRLDDDVGLHQVGRLTQLGVGKRGLHRATPAEQHDLVNLTVLEGLDVAEPAAVRGALMSGQSRRGSAGSRFDQRTGLRPVASRLVSDR
jgi:hypothetical protein